MKVLYVFLTVGVVVCLLLSFERPAMAYVDPGSGLFLFQSISSVGLGVLFFLRRRVKALFRQSTPSRPVVVASPGELQANASVFETKKAA